MKVNYYLRFAPVLLLLTAACDPLTESTNSVYKDEMRSLVIELAAYARESSPAFIVIPQNGQELITVDGNASSALSADYLAAIDGVGREDLFYGFRRDNAATPDDETERMLEFLFRCEESGVEVLVTDYCSSQDKMDDSYFRNHDNGFASFAAPERDLNLIPSYPAGPYGMNQENIHTLSEVRNFLYLIDPGEYSSREAFLSGLENTDYDLLLVDAFDMNGGAFSPAELNRLKVKKSGGKRLVIAYMSIGEAEDYRYYWDQTWYDAPPDWLAEENPDWKGNYKVEYWDQEWKDILYGSEGSYLDRILASGFDGVYLDIIDAFEYFEQLD